MKTKHLLTMMALPALFAACAQDELVESTAVGLEGRALLDPNFSINVVGEGVDSRFSWNEYRWGWNDFTADDKFSAGLVDYPGGGVLNKMLTNYVFSSANEGISYTTTSQMVEGTYFFYSYPGFETNEKAAEVAFDLTSQTKIDLNDAAATVNANQLFVSPLYKLSAGHANIELPLYFVSYWSTVGLKIKNTTGEAFKVRRITLEKVSDDFVVKGTISPTALNTAKLKYSWSNDAEAYVLPEDITNSNMLTENIATAAVTGGKQNVITVDCQAYELADGEGTTAYIQIPAGEHEAESITVKVIVETIDQLGETILKSLEFPMECNGDKDNDGVKDFIELKRGYTIPAYGIENGGIKAYEIDKIKLTGADKAGNGIYADSYKALEEALLGATTPVTINNLGALKLDDNAMYLLSNLKTGAKALFENAIEITSIGKGTVKNAKFIEGAEVVAGDITIGDNVELPVDKTLTIAENAAATIVGGTFSGTIANNGKLTLAYTTVPKIMNGAKSEMIIDADVTLASSNVNAPKSLTINANKTLTANNFTIGYGKTVTNNGKIDVSDATGFKINGTVDNYGTIVNGTLKGLADQNSDGEAETAKINNYKVIDAITTDKADGPAKIKQMSVDAEAYNVAGDGVIDNTNNGIVTKASGSSVAVYAEYEGDQTGKLGDVMAATKVILKSGIWTSPELPTGIATLELDEVELTSENPISLSVTDLTLISCTVSKDLTFDGVATAKLEGTKFNAPVVIDDLGTLDLKGMTINYAFTADDATVINILGGADGNDVETTTIAAPLTLGSVTNLNIAQYAKLYLSSNGSLDISSATVTNNGAVENRGHIFASSDNGDGTWKGNAIEQ